MRLCKYLHKFDKQNHTERKYEIRPIILNSKGFTHLLQTVPCRFPSINYILTCVWHSTSRHPMIWMSFVFLTP